MKGQNSGGEQALATTPPDPLREMASALVDGEASEFETRRLLESLGDPGVSALLARHYTVRSVLRRDASALCPPGLTDAILASVHAENVPVSGPFAARWKNWAGGAAVAASVCLVTVVGLRGLPGDTPAAPEHTLAASAVGLGTLGAPANAPVLARSGAIPVGLGAAIPASADDADRVAEQRLRMYMLEHARNASLNTPQGMIPYVRVDAREQP